MECVVFPDDVENQIVDVIFPGGVDGAMYCIRQGIIKATVPLRVLLVIHSLEVFHSMWNGSEE